MPFILKYWKVLLIIGILVGTFFAGMRLEKLNNDSDLLKERDEAIANFEEEITRNYQLGKQLEHERALRTSQVAKLKKSLADAIAVDPVFRNECISDDGLRIINDAIDNKLTPR